MISLFLETGEVPTKCVCTQETMHISANVVYIDFEGRSDGESIRKIITQIKPRQLVSNRKKSLMYVLPMHVMPVT